MPVASQLRLVSFRSRRTTTVLFNKCTSFSSCHRGPIFGPHDGTFSRGNGRESFLEIIESCQESILFHHESTQLVTGSASSRQPPQPPQQCTPASGSSRLRTVLSRCPMPRPGIVAAAPTSTSRSQWAATTVGTQNQTCVGGTASFLQSLLVQDSPPTEY